MGQKISFTVIMKVAKLGIKKWMTSPRMYVVAILAALFMWAPLEQIRIFAMQQELSVSNWYFPLMWADDNGMIVLFLYFDIILMFCNAPFVDRQQIFVLLRSGKKNWFLGQLLYIVSAAVIYFLYIFVLTIVEFIPYVGFSLRWESVFESLANYTYVSADMRASSMPTELIHNLMPLQAFALSFLVNVLIAVLLGELIFLVNLFKNRGYGTGAALAVVLFSWLIGDAVFGSKLNYFSPISWSDITIIFQENTGVPLAYILSVLICGDILLAVLIMYRSRHYSIEAMEEI